MKNNIFQNKKKLVRREAMFHTFADGFDVQLNKKRQWGVHTVARDYVQTP